MAGTYRDSQYSVETLKDEADAARRGRTGKKYVIRYGDPDEGDLLEDVNKWAAIDPKDVNVTYPAGTWHEMESGIYHATPIPSSLFCSTLVVISPQVAGAEDALVGNPNFGTQRHKRSACTPEEKVVMCRQFRAALSGQNPPTAREMRSAPTSHSPTQQQRR